MLKTTLVLYPACPGGNYREVDEILPRPQWVKDLNTIERKMWFETMRRDMYLRYILYQNKTEYLSFDEYMKTTDFIIDEIVETKKPIPFYSDCM